MSPADTVEDDVESTKEVDNESKSSDYIDDPRVTSDEDRTFGRCCGKPLKASGDAWRRARETMRRGAGKSERRGVYVNVTCPDCGFLRRILVGRRTKKKKRERR